MNPIDQLIDSYMAEGMSEIEAINQVKEDALKGRKERKKTEASDEVRLSEEYQGMPGDEIVDKIREENSIDLS